MQTESFFGTKPINNDDAIIKTLGIKSPSEVLQYDALKKGVLSVNEARRIAGIEPVNEFQKAVDVVGSTIRRATNCPNCGANLTQNGVCAYCGTTYN
jgi:CO dehydrogenase/acetyl-CoA synthase alpha subunit